MCAGGGMTPNPESIKPRPFCGEIEIRIIEGTTFRWRRTMCSWCGVLGPEVRIQTLGAGTRDEWERAGEAEAIKEWNTRHEP